MGVLKDELVRSPSCARTLTSKLISSTDSNRLLYSSQVSYDNKNRRPLPHSTRRHAAQRLSSYSPVGGSATQHMRLRNYFQLSTVRYIFKANYTITPHLTFLLDWNLFTCQDAMLWYSPSKAGTTSSIRWLSIPNLLNDFVGTSQAPTPPAKLALSS